MVTNQPASHRLQGKLAPLGVLLKKGHSTHAGLHPTAGRRLKADPFEIQNPQSSPESATLATNLCPQPDAELVP